jgi:hypothetical protein
MILCLTHGGARYFVIGDMVTERDTFLFSLTGAYEYHSDCMSQMSPEDYLDEHYLTQTEAVQLVAACEDQITKLLSSV